MNLPGLAEFLFNFCANDFFKILLTNVLFPEPDTPVTATNSPNGNSTLIFFRLFSEAPVILIAFPLPLRRSFGTGIDFFPERYFPVKEFSSLATSSGVPAATICPPCSPAPGPTSIK